MFPHKRTERSELILMLSTHSALFLLLKQSLNKKNKKTMDFFVHLYRHAHRALTINIHHTWYRSPLCKLLRYVCLHRDIFGYLHFALLFSNKVFVNTFLSCLSDCMLHIGKSLSVVSHILFRV